MVELGRQMMTRLQSFLKRPDLAQPSAMRGSEAGQSSSDAAILDELCPKVAPGEWPEDLTNSW